MHKKMMLKFNGINILNKHDSNYHEEYEGFKKWKFEKDFHVVVIKKKGINLAT